MKLMLMWIQLIARHLLSLLIIEFMTMMVIILVQLGLAWPLMRYKN